MVEKVEGSKKAIKSHMGAKNGNKNTRTLMILNLSDEYMEVHSYYFLKVCLKIPIIKSSNDNDS